MSDPILTSSTPPARPSSRFSGLFCAVAGTISLLCFLAALLRYLQQIDGDTPLILALSLIALASAVAVAGTALFERQPRWNWVCTAIGTTAASISFFACLAFLATVLMLRLQHSMSQAKNFTPKQVEIEPITIPDDSMKSADARQAWRTWLEKHVSEPTVRGAAGRPDEAITSEIMAAFVKDWSLDWDMIGHAGWNELAAKYLEVHQGPPTCLLIVAGRSDFPVNVAASDSAIERIRRDEKNPFWQFYLEMQRAEKLSKSNGYQKELEESRDFAIAAFDRMLTEGFFAPDEMGMLADFTGIGYFPDLFKARGERLLEIADSHDLPEWFRELLRGKLHTQIAWEKRGNGFANTVTAEGRTAFRDHLGIARRHLEHSWTLAPHQPYAASEMIKVSMGSSDDPAREMRQWLDRATAAQCDFWPAFEAYLWGMRPRWHGSHAEMLAFAGECLATGRFDTSVPSYYISTLRKISEDTGNEIYRRPGVYNHVREVIDGYLATSPSPAAENFRRTTLAAIAFRSGHFDDLREQWAHLQGKHSRREFGAWSADRHEFFFRATMGEGSTTLRESLAASEAGDFTRAISKMEEAARDPDLTPEQSETLNHRAALLRIGERYQTGEWIDLFREDRSQWRNAEGRFEFRPDGSMAVTSDSIRYAVDHPLHLGEHFEVELDLETREGMLNTSGPGILLSDRSFESKSWITYYVRRRESGKREFVVAHYRYTDYHRSAAPTQDRVKLRLVCHDTEWRAFADGREIQSGPIGLKADFIGENTRLALGGWTTRPIASHSQVFYGIRVRKLPAPEPVGGEKENGSPSLSEDEP